MIGSGHLTLVPTRIITEFIFILQCGYWLKVGIMFIPNTTLWWIVLTQFPRLNHHTVCTEVSRQWNQTTLKCVIMSYLNKLKYDRQFQFTEIALVFVLRLCWVTTLLCGVYSNCYWVNVGPVCTTQARCPRCQGTRLRYMICNLNIDLGGNFQLLSYIALTSQPREIWVDWYAAREG